MRIEINEGIFDSGVETSDWRYSAGILGLIRYFDFLDEKEIEKKENLYEIEEDILKYNSKMISEENYLLFVEYFFKEHMHHLVVEEILKKEEITKEEENIVNEKLSLNKAMESIFRGIKYSKANHVLIEYLIEENRFQIIKNTYKNGLNLYGKFNNKNSLFKEEEFPCRVLNYYADGDKKSKGLGYFWDKNSFVYNDDKIFDFIPFAFSKSYESFFINNNYKISSLIKSNLEIQNSKDSGSFLFNSFKENYIDFDLEVITKEREKDYYKTLFIRKESIKILRKIKNYDRIKVVYRDCDRNNPDYLEKDIIDCILNKINLDWVIEMLMKSRDYDYSYNIETLIYINNLMYGENIKNDYFEKAIECSEKINSILKVEEIIYFKDKLIQSILFKDYNGFYKNLLKLSSYSKVVFNFAYDLFEDFEKNKNIAYAFINGLDTKEKRGGIR